MPEPVTLRELLERGNPVELRAALHQSLMALQVIDLQHPFERWNIRWQRLIALLPVSLSMWMLTLLLDPDARNGLNAFAFVLNVGTAAHIIVRAERHWHRWRVTRSNMREAAQQLHLALQQQGEH